MSCKNENYTLYVWCILIMVMLLILYVKSGGCPFLAKPSTCLPSPGALVTMRALVIWSEGQACTGKLQTTVKSSRWVNGSPYKSFVLPTYIHKISWIPYRSFRWSKETCATSAATYRWEALSLPIGPKKHLSPPPDHPLFSTGWIRTTLLQRFALQIQLSFSVLDTNTVPGSSIQYQLCDHYNDHYICMYEWMNVDRSTSLICFVVTRLR